MPPSSRLRNTINVSSSFQACSHHAPVKALHQYKKRVEARPKVFTFDLAGYGSLTFPETNVYCLAGFSDKTLETLSLLDQDHQALLRQIANVVI
jgi:60 kDa SS-A/Ro ribonucleoprotein